MIHVFHLDQARMLTFDVNYVPQPVKELQSALKDVTSVPTEHQVLIISGGEVMHSNKRVSDFGCIGTESDPIFLANREGDENDPISYDHGIREYELTLKEYSNQLNVIQNQSASFENVRLLGIMGKTTLKRGLQAWDLCQSMVDDQKFMYAGWSCMTANLEDVVKSAKRRMERFLSGHQRLRESHRKFIEIFDEYPKNLELAKKIILPPSLLKESTILKYSPNDPEPKTLYDWMNAVDPNHDISVQAEPLKTLLKTIMEFDIVGFTNEWKEFLAGTKDANMKEIRGISKRLSQLDEFLNETEPALADHKQHATGMTVMDEKINMCHGDVNLLDDIRRQSEMMYRVAAFRRRFSVLKMVHDSPTFYASIIGEVIRRRSFSHEFIGWASTLVERSQMLRDEELELRAAFYKKFEKHFLKTMFPGLTDQLPVFATSLPLPFDQNLPHVQSEHLQELRGALPELKPYLQVTKPSVYDRMTVIDPAGPSGSAIRREPSFISHNPPRFVQAAKSYPSSTWLSGDENLSEFSPSQGISSVISSTPPTKLGFSPLGFGGSSGDLTGGGSVVGVGGYSPTTIGGVGCFPSSSSSTALLPSPLAAAAAASQQVEDKDVKQRGDGVEPEEPPTSPPMVTAPETAQATPTNVASPCSTSRSAPIRIPSRPPSMATSRQMSERSSPFGTPEEDIIQPYQQHTEATSEDLGHSLPEVISKSEIIETALSELHRTTGGDSASGSKSMLIDSSTKPLTFAINSVRQPSDLSPKMSADELADKLSGIAVETTQTSMEFAGLQEVLDLQRDIDAKNTEIAALNEQMTSQSVANQQLVVQHKNKLESEVFRFRSELTAIRDMLVAAGTDHTEAVRTIHGILDRARPRLEASVQEQLAEAERATMTLQREELDKERKVIESELKQERDKIVENEKMLGHQEAALTQKDVEITTLKENFDSEKSDLIKQMESEKAEISKQLIIDNELSMQQLREGFRNEILDRETLVNNLRVELKERDELVGQMKKEKDQLVTSMYEQQRSGAGGGGGTPTSAGSVPNTSSPLEDKLRAEIEREFRDKLQLLLKGAEDKKSDALERAQAEKSVELRLLREEKEKELESLKAQTDLEINQIKVSLNQAVAETELKNREIDRLRSELETFKNEQTQVKINLLEEATSPTRSSPKLVNPMSKSVMENSVMMSQSFAQISSPESPNMELAAQDIEVLASDESEKQEDQQQDAEAEESSTSDNMLEDAEDPSTSSAVKSNSIRHHQIVQTRMRIKDMHGMINVVDVNEGDVVLVRFDERHLHYVIFQTSHIIHFVKDSCIKRMELPQAKDVIVVNNNSNGSGGSGNTKAAGGGTSPSSSNQPQANIQQRPSSLWCLARVTRKQDYCQIKKTGNRYRLPVNTKFYRVEVERFELPSSRSNSNRLSASGPTNNPSTTTTTIPNILPKIQEVSRTAEEDHHNKTEKAERDGNTGNK